MGLRSSRISTTRRGAGLLAAATAAAFGATAAAQTIGSGQPISNGQTVTLREDTNYLSTNPLTLDGGTLNIRNTVNSTGVTVNATDALLRNGLIGNVSPQFGNTINFFGTTTVGGPATAGPFPANFYVYFSAPTESSWVVTNRGEIVQNRDIVLMGNTILRNIGISGSPPSSNVNFLIDNDFNVLGDPQKSGIPGGVYPTVLAATGGFVTPPTAGLLFERGTRLVKRDGTGTSEIRVPVMQNGGTVMVTSGGELALTNGGLHHNSVFAGNPLGGPVDGTIRFGGAHVFTGLITTETGKFLQDADSVIRLTRASLPLPTDQWNQRATFTANGTIDLDGTLMVNSGDLKAAMITGRRAANGTPAQFVNTGVFEGNMRAGHNGFTPDLAQTIEVDNWNTFNIQDGQVVEIAKLDNLAGTLLVNGGLINYRAASPGNMGILRILGGELKGHGIINADTFVGSLPGPAAFRPGTSPGTMTINGDFSLLPGGVLELEVESTPGGIAFDRVAVSGSILLDGRVSIIVGAGVQQSDMAGLGFFDCGGPCAITYGSHFTWDLPGRPGSVLTASATGLDVTTLAPVPEPEPYALMLAGLGLAGWMARRRRRA